ncbi:hypothetical protein [Sphingomonas montana]|uniref:hypothetical protein n=1 Tax=Sphingomonas montana TaxID=1843236 RepID=UPI00096F2B70|nr:hypothetical protein [Sphingomonas montana]
MLLTLNSLYASPDHYLHSFDGRDALFVPMDRAAYHRSIFLDGRISPAAEGSLRLPVATLLQAVPRPAPTGWIFHVAHCGSTLLASALDLEPGNLVLREPLGLRQLAFDAADGRLDVMLAILSRRYDPDRPTIVKANVPVNFMLPALVQRDPAARAIFLHLPLRGYLHAILRSDPHRQWVRRVTTQQAARLGDMTGWSDAARAAALWLAQMRAFAAAIVAMPHARSLDAETFLTDPRPVLARAAAHLDVPLSDPEIAERVAGPLFATYSKNRDVPFSNADRLARRRQAETDLAGEIAIAETWIAPHADLARAATATIAAVALCEGA